MGRRAILHIGTEKTGTSTLQGTLAANRDALAGAGFVYPQLGPIPAHLPLVFAAAGDKRPLRDIRAMLGIARDTPYEEAAAAIEAKLAEELAAAPAADAIFSTEHAHSRLRTGPSIARLKRLLDRHFDRVDVVCYLRRWDRVVVSLYSTYLHNGGCKAFSLTDLAPPDYLDYPALLARWEAAFGREHLTVARYDRNSLAGGSIVTDFAARFGLALPVAIPDGNVALNGGMQQLYRRINGKLADAPDRAAAVRGFLAHGAAATDDIAAFAPSREQARAFVAAFAADAEAIRARYFPADVALFDDDFDDYRDDAECPGLNASRLLDIVIAATAAHEQRPSAGLTDG